MADNDIFSKIPDHIIHCILAFLPSIKDVVRTSYISKSWHQAWLTFPITQFNLRDILPFRSRGGKEEQPRFIRFVDNTLQRFKRQNGDGMKIFNLSTLNEMAHHHTTRWIGMTLDIKVEHLALDIFLDNSFPCLIPDRILCAYSLKSLKLVGPAICIQSLNESSHVDLPSLTSLCIQDSKIPDERLQKLLSGCPALEDIALLYCESLSKVDIFDHPNLKTLEFSLRESIRADPHVAIRVRAPKLKSFSYNFHRWSRCAIVVKIYNSPELKSLRICDKYKTDEWLDQFITQFPLLDNLTIEHCYSLRKIRISNPILEKINIKQCHNLEDMVISSKKLKSLSLFTKYLSIPNPSILMEMDNPPNDCMANISNPAIVWCTHLMDATWYCKLKEFLTRPITFKSLVIEMIAIYAVDGDMNGKDVHKKLPHPALNIEKLSIRVNAPSSCHPHILNGLLSTCHPKTIELDVDEYDFFGKLVCEELSNREHNNMCWCKDDFKCWKHQLKEVKIEKIKGIKVEENLDWDILSVLLPTLKAENTIYFKLMW